MASYLQIENISKSYGPKILFEHIGFNVNEGDKIALIAPNGTGKTSLLRILAGEDKSDSGGKILFLKDIRIAFLQQEYDFDPKANVFDQIIAHSSPHTASMHEEARRDFEQRVREQLSNFNLGDLSRRMEELSGGEIKRVALSEMLALEADFLIMDEPTNHLDIEAIEYLEGYLRRSRCTLLMVTHDRYFLDRVCNTVMELDHGAVYIYKGDYQNYLEKREERITNYNAETDKVRNLLRRELEWIHATPCARSGKAKYRINAFHELSERASQAYRTKQITMEGVGQASRLGTKIINCSHVDFYWGEQCMLRDFTYNFQRYDKIGIVGRNGIGKSTFLDLLTGSLREPVSGAPGSSTISTPSVPLSGGRLEPASGPHNSQGSQKAAAGTGLREHATLGTVRGGTASAVGPERSEGVSETSTGGRCTMNGTIERGESLKIGYYRQEGMDFERDETVLEIVNDTRLLNRFLFPHDMLSTRVSKLSGGEKRRLYLLTILMREPNLLILDEPTNDLDIVTLNILEEYLREFKGSLLIVSHDRHFLDRVADHLLVFCGEGKVKDFVGSFSEYRSYIKDYEAQQKKASEPSRPTVQQVKETPKKNLRLSWKEQRELEALEAELPALEEEKKALEAEMSSGTLDYGKLQEKAARVQEIMDTIDKKEMRWMELQEKTGI